MEGQRHLGLGQLRLPGAFVRCAMIFLVLTLALSQVLDAQGAFSCGEKLRYKVRWTFIRLGTVEIEQCAIDPNAPDLRQFKMSVKSAVGIPFVDLDFTHTATAALDPLDLKTLTIQHRTEDSLHTTYTIDGVRNQLVVVDSSRGEVILSDTLAIGQKCYEAVSLLFLARSHASTTATMSICTLVGKSFGETILEFSGESEEIEVPALEEPIEAYHFSGDARWVGSGFAGMSGDFEGWISRDDAAVPLRAEVGIFLGSVVLELESFERSYWRAADTASSSDGRMP